MAYIGRHTHLEASTSGFRDNPGPPSLVDVLGYVPAHRQGQRNGQQVWYFFVVFFWHATPLSVRCDTEPIFARWRRPVSSHEALNPLYWSMLAVLHRRIISSVETGWTEVHSFVVDKSGIDLNIAN